jgi:LmbE family N-acetylglucosaminyl deacetylase
MAAPASPNRTIAEFDSYNSATCYKGAVKLMWTPHRLIVSTVVSGLALLSAASAAAQGTSRTLVAVFAHPDDETSAAIIATDGAAGGSYTSIPRGPELARARAEEAACAATALGVKPPILLGFPDAQLGNYAEDPTRVYRLTQRIQEELQRLHPDALITWGPDGGTGHPDHRLVSSIVTQLVRAGATGAPEHLFYSAIPVEGIRAMNPGRGEPPFLVPQAKYFSTRVPFTPADADAAVRSMACHRTQYSAEVVERITGIAKSVLNGVLPLAPAFAADAGSDLFGSGKK